MGVLKTSPLELETLAWLYTDCDWTLQQIARAFGHQQNWVTRRLREHGVPIRKPEDWVRKPRGRQTQDDDKIVRLYVEEGLSIKKIGLRLDWSPTYVRRRLLALDIPLRDRGSGNKKRGANHSQDERIAHLRDIGYTVPHIARDIHWSESFVRDRLRDMGYEVKRVGGIERIPESEVRLVRRLYIDLDMEMGEVARHVGKSLGWVRNRLFRGGTPIRTKSEVMLRYNAKQRRDRESSQTPRPSPSRPA